MPPAQQGFEPRDFICVQFHERLVENLELAKRKCLSQIELKRTSGLHPGVHLLLEEPVHASSILFRAIKRHVSVLQETIDVIAVTGRERNAYARADDDLVAVDLIWLCNHRNEPGSKGNTVDRLAGRELHDRKLVASQPSNAVGCPQALPDPA